MEEPELHITQRRLPHWTVKGSVYFITFRLLRGTLSVQERKLVLQHLRSGEPCYYHLAAATVMPDHVHLLIKPLQDVDLSRIMKGIKGVSARQLNLGAAPKEPSGRMSRVTGSFETSASSRRNYTTCPKTR